MIQGKSERAHPVGTAEPEASGEVCVDGSAEARLLGGNDSDGCGILEAASVSIGNTVGIVIKGGGGPFVGIVAAIEREVARLTLTEDAGAIPRGTLLTVLVNQIAAVGKLPT